MLTNGHFKGGTGEKTGRVQGGQWRDVGRYEEGDLGADEGHGVTASCLQMLDDADVLLARGIGKNAID